MVAKEDGRRLKHGLTLVHPANHLYYRHILGQIEQARRLGNTHRIVTLNKAAVALERYPVPVNNAEEALNVAGVGEVASKIFEAVIKKHGEPKPTQEQCEAHAQKVFNRIRAFLDITTFDEDITELTGDWKPKKYSNSWTFILVLGLYTDGNKRISLEQILDYSEDIRARIPSCRLNNFEFLKTLIDKGIVEFSRPSESHLARGSKDKTSTEYVSRYRRCYDYGLTALGQCLAEEIISNCEVPISINEKGVPVFSQAPTSMSTALDPDATANPYDLEEDDIFSISELRSYRCVYDSQFSVGARLDVNDISLPPSLRSNGTLDLDCYIDSISGGSKTKSRMTPTASPGTREGETPNSGTNTLNNASDQHNQMESSKTPNITSESVNSSSVVQRQPSQLLPRLTSSINVGSDSAAFVSYPTGTRSFGDNEMVTASSVGVTFNTQNLTNQGSTCDASYQSLDNFCYSASGDVADAGSVPSDIYPRSSRIETMKLYDDLSDPYELMDDHGQISDRYRKLMEDYSDVARCYSQGYEYIEAQTQASVGHDDISNRAELTSPGTQERLQNCTSIETRTPVRNLLDLGLTQQTPIEISSSSKSDNDVRITTMQTSDVHVSTPPKLVPQCEPAFDLDAALNEYELLTVVDNRELHDAAGRYQRRLVELYTGNDKQLVFRQLPLGDVIWLLKRKTDIGNMSTQECSTPKTPRARKHKRRNTQSLAGDYEHNDRSDGNASKSASRGRKKCETADDLAGAYVLEWVVERKTTADLAASINDGRYYDQKIRMLRLTGFKHVCYIFEDMDIGSAVSRVSAMSGRVSKASITSARIHTQMVTGFNVLRTTGMPHTAASIAFMHMHIGKVLQGRIRQANLTSAEELHSMLGKRYMTLAEWEVRNRKQNQMTYKELFGKQIRAIPGCSANITQAILDTWPTPHLLAKGISRSNLAQINATLTKKLPKSKRAPISSKMYALYKKLYTKPRNALSLSTGGRLEAAAGSLYEDLAYTNLSCQL